MASTVITFSKDGVQPPVFVAGTFTNWVPVEMSCETNEDGTYAKVFSYTVDIDPGEYQYKFRLGPGDWWVFDESKPTASDDSGNVNNVLTVKPEDTRLPPPHPTSKTPIPAISTADTPKSNRTLERQTVKDPATSLHTAEEAPDPDREAEDIVQPNFVVVEEKPVAPSQARIDKLPSMENDPKRRDEGSEKVVGSLDAMREDHPIPDIAPPPYSVQENNIAASSFPQTGSPSADAVKGQPESKQSGQSWFARMCSRNDSALDFVFPPLKQQMALYTTQDKGSKESFIGRNPRTKTHMSEKKDQWNFQPTLAHPLMNSSFSSEHGDVKDDSEASPS
ncbi:uncharacterized protein Z518_03809 [Rhinocladiella mackenziei CBS 650.93]|uniref:AMP-activated protein kinase glycogen-binding domain-containing protein n=1 Tax=Rhinocladiella mackenziei CBS 650.93 TaxID=1442369 RepID=A0A0D2IRS1_9EURO|nr:uncharacterized protein Z518_03809 [Rhinocladiella mackenziei CBS 650.93]KIX05836.1 hypothetical protein Z518_03809 [Rhinocladiella mackenziei CBS 650.93]